MGEIQATYLQHSWKKLKSNKSAMIGLVIITISVIVAIFAYWLAPDHSPFANRMIVEIAGKKPGYTQAFLVLYQGGDASTGFIERTVSGKREYDEYIPIQRYQIRGDSIYADVYLDEGVTSPAVYLIYQNKYQVIKRTFYLGTDKFGRDILSRLIIGTRVSLSVGLIAVFISSVLTNAICFSIF